MSTSTVLDESKYAKLSWLSYLKMKFDVLRMPLYLGFEALASPFVARSKGKPFKRVIGDATFRYVSDSLSIPRMQAFLGTTQHVYTTWAKQRKLDTVIDEVPGGGKLMWIGPKRTEKVILYIHGGGFIFPIPEFAFSFWRWVQLEMEKSGVQVGVAIMSYSLVPVGVFPTPLRQATAGIGYLLDQGTQPQNLQLVGDSAGGNLISQVLSHMLHPLPTVAPLNLPPDTRLRGAYMMSPWVTLSCQGESFKSNDHADLVGRRTLMTWGSAVLKDVPESQLTYIEPINAPDEWYNGLQNVVDRVLVTTGDWECLRDPDVIFFEKKIKPHHANAELVVQERGVHDDPFFEFMVADKPFCSNTLSSKILEWLSKGFEA